MNKIEKNFKDKNRLFEELLEDLPENYTGTVELYIDITDKSMSRYYAIGYFKDGKLHNPEKYAVYIQYKDIDEYHYYFNGELLGYKASQFDAFEYDIDRRIFIKNEDIAELTKEYIKLKTGEVVPNIKGLICFELDLIQEKIAKLEFEIGQLQSEINAPVDTRTEDEKLKALSDYFNL